MKNIFIKIKNFIYRGIHGWCPEDTWSLDEYLARVISEATGYLAKTVHGFPPELTFKRWKEILKQISKDIIIKDDYKTEKEQLKAYEKRKEALKLFVTYFNNLWD